MKARVLTTTSTQQKKKKLDEAIIALSFGFTLIELLLVIGIISIVAAAAVLIIDPAEMLARSRDGARVKDLRTIENAALFESDLLDRL